MFNSYLTSVYSQSKDSPPQDLPPSFPMNASPAATPSAEPWLTVVRDKVAAIRFGSVQITVHEGRVTQIEANEKTRFPTALPSETLLKEKTPKKK